ncbi:MAG: hypothetical protein OEV43_04275 [Coriobacteriia bacterium]|nr:hypothetical protein [Coriobacteriia bacterium]
MADCGMRESCRSFFAEGLQNMPRVARLYRERYCLGDFESCARHRLSKELGREQVPRTLYPNDHDKLSLLLADMAS